MLHLTKMVFTGDPRSEVHLHAERLLAYLGTQKNAVWSASLTAQEAQDIELDLHHTKPLTDNCRTVSDSAPFTNWPANHVHDHLRMYGPGYTFHRKWYPLRLTHGPKPLPYKI